MKKLLLVIIFVCIGFVLIPKIGKIDKSPKLTERIDENMNENHLSIEPEREYNERFQYLSSELATETGLMQSEKEITKIFKELGFTQSEIRYEFEENGKSKNDVAKDDSDDKHPYYYAVYLSEEKDMLWYISSIGGCITANLIYEDEDGLGSDYFYAIAEDKEIISYDAMTKKYYRVIPKEKYFNMTIVDKVNADSLNAYEQKEKFYE